MRFLTLEFLAALVLLLNHLAWAWVVGVPTTIHHHLSRNSINRRGVDLVVVRAGGFGGGGDGKKKAKKLVKLKPKSQWDRFVGMKGASRIRVAVRTTNAEDSEWLQVGHIKSVDDAYTALAVARQRALIAEHAKRLFPLQVSIKDTVQWAYWKEDSDEWITVDKSVLDDEDVPDDLEKRIGFEGRPDPSSGYYCMYNEGRLVNDGEESRPSSKKLK